jgi:hypothetical protein
MATAGGVREVDPCPSKCSAPPLAADANGGPASSVFDGLLVVVQDFEDPIEPKTVKRFAHNRPQAAEIELASKRSNIFAQRDEPRDKRTADDVQEGQIEYDSAFGAVPRERLDDSVDLPRLRSATG